MLASAAVVVSAPAALTGALILVVARNSRRLALALAAAMAAPSLVTWEPFVREVGAAARLLTAGPTAEPGGLAAVWPHVWRWWLYALPLAPLYAGALHVLRPRGAEELENARQRSEGRRSRRRASRATRRAGRLSGIAPEPPEKRRLIAVGARIEGDRLLARGRARAVSMPLDWLRRHALVIGPSGSGKTETLLRLADGAARHGWSVFYIDAKGDRAGASRFAATMGSAGRRATVFPAVALDCWRGDARAIHNRLIELVPYSTEGDGAYYRDVAKRVLWRACGRDGAPPRSSAELLERLSSPRRSAGRDAAEEVVDPRLLHGVRLRYEAFFEALGGQADGATSFEDTEALYVLLDGLRLKEEAQSLARMLIEDFADFATRRKPPGQHALLIVDEYSAIAEAGRVVELVERLRSFNVGVVLAPQAESGMGGPLTSDRVIQNMETVFLHGLRRPEGIVSLAGTERAIESSYQENWAWVTGMGSSRSQHVFRVDPNEVRALEPGQCFVIRGGRAEKVMVARVPAPGAAVALPPSAPAPRPPQPKRARMPL